jgi:putative restriction endonuclease
VAIKASADILVSIPTPASDSLSSLLRKAAADAGFDLEPEHDGGWWRLRASAVPGVAWVRRVGSALSLASGGARLALPLASQLAELGTPLVDSGASSDGGAPTLPAGAAGQVVCASPEALHSALRRVWMLRVQAPARLRARWDAEVASTIAAAALVAVPGAATSLIPTDAPLVTEALAEVRRRVGQELYREALFDLWGGRCAATGLAIPELLRASHAKPWAHSSDAERLDAHNGLLLAVHVDALFDRGLVTFNDDGRGRLSHQLSAEAIDILGLSSNVPHLRFVRPAHQPYLSYHREHVFRP